MKRRLLSLVGVLTGTLMYSQSELKVFQDWSRNTGSQHFFYKNVTKTDGSGNVFLAGATQNAAGNYDLLVAKYNASGVQQWIHQIDGAAHYQDFATALQIDNLGNIFITGAITNDTTTLLSDLIVVKYNSSGVEQWRNTYDGAGSYDCGTDIVAKAGVAYITGSSVSATGNFDFVTISYNSSGVQQWATRYNYTAGMNDVPVQIERSGTSIVVSGAVQTGTTSYKWAVAKYNSSTGAFLSVKFGASGATSIEEVHDMTTDADGNIYLAGTVSTLSNGYDFDVIKMDSSLNIQWENTYDALHYNDIANGLKVNASGDVYVTGSSKNSSGHSDYLTLKYDASGTLLWTRTYDDSLSGNDEATAIALDNSGNPVITGSIQTGASQIDYYTLKYDASGTVKWGIALDGSKHLDDKATNIAIDTVGAIIVTGQSETATGVYEYVTVRYVEKNIVVPTDFSGAAANKRFLYYENKGQLTSTDDITLVPRVRFYTDNASRAIYIMNDTMSMILAHTDMDTATVDSLQRVNMCFDKSSRLARVYPLEKQADYLNYFLGNCPDGITKIYGNQRLVVTDLYPNIDLIYYSDSIGFKYYFVLKPGADPTDIEIKYSGMDTTFVSSNHLTVGTAIGNAVYSRPFQYQLNSSNDTIAGSGKYASWSAHPSNKYTFTLQPYDSTKVLVIEAEELGVDCGAPISSTNIRVSTFYGGTKDDRINGIGLDTINNMVYYGGEAFSNSFTPQSGLYVISTNTLLTHAILSKFNTYGSRQYATYYGGTGGNTSISGVTVSAAGEPTIVGYTSSTNMVLHHTGSQYYQAKAGTYDGFVTRWRADGGALKFAAYFGGTGYDVLNRVIMKGNETYVVGTGDNTSPHVSKSGAYNSLTTPSGTKGVIAHFNSSDSLVWSTFIGDDIKDVDYSSNLLGIGGQIKTSDLPYTSTAGTYVDSTFAGATDGFIAILNASDHINFATYLGGTQEDKCSAVKFDIPVGANPPNLYAGGGTASLVSQGFDLLDPGSGAYFGINYHGNGDACMWKFSGTGVRLYSSYYGTGTEALQFDEIEKIAIDKYNNAYFCGKSNSILEHQGYNPGTPWYSQSYTAVSSAHQCFLFGLSPNFHLFWATNYGGSLGEWSTDIATDRKLNYMYFAGVTYSQSPFPAYLPPGGTSGWFMCENSSPGMSDGFFVQFKTMDAPLVGIDENHLKPESDLICYPNPFNDQVTVNFSLGESKAYTIEVYNTLGQRVYYLSEKSNMDNITKTIELPVNKGIYFVEIKLTNRTLAGKILKQ